MLPNRERDLRKDFRLGIEANNKPDTEHQFSEFIIHFLIATAQAHTLLQNNLSLIKPAVDIRQLAILCTVTYRSASELGEK